MASTVRSIGAMPFQGGSFASDSKGHAMAKLTATRAVWLYYQTNPNWLASSVIDVPGGFTGNGAPTITNQQLLLPLAQTSYMQAARINQNTFVLMTCGSPAYTGNMVWYVFEVDTGGVFTRVDQGTFTYGTTTTAGAYSLFGVSSFKVLELKDNLVMYVASNLDKNVPNNVGGVKGSYDATAKKMTWDTTVTQLINYTGLTANFELIARPVPSRDMTLLQIRYFGPSGGNLTTGVMDLRGASGVVIDNQTGTVVTSQNQLPLNSYVAASANVYSDMVPLPGDRIAILNSNSSIQFFSVNYTGGSFINLGSSQFQALAAADILGSYLLPLTTDYVLKMQRQPMFTPSTTPHRFKVIRRVDQNMSEQSAASSLNAGAGFGTTTAPTTIAAFHQNYPEFIDGKIIWFGLDSATAPTKFSWTVISLDQPTQ